MLVKNLNLKTNQRIHHHRHYHHRGRHRNCVQCCHGHLVIPSIFCCYTTVLRGNSDALNQSHLRNFSGYIIKGLIFTQVLVFKIFCKEICGDVECTTLYKLASSNQLMRFLDFEAYLFGIPGAESYMFLLLADHIINLFQRFLYKKKADNCVYKLSIRAWETLVFTVDCRTSTSDLYLCSFVH